MHSRVHAGGGQFSILSAGGNDFHHFLGRRHVNGPRLVDEDAALLVLTQLCGRTRGEGSECGCVCECAAEGGEGSECGCVCECKAHRELNAGTEGCYYGQYWFTKYEIQTVLRAIRFWDSNLQVDGRRLQQIPDRLHVNLNVGHLDGELKVGVRLVHALKQPVHHTGDQTDLLKLAQLSIRALYVYARDVGSEHACGVCAWEGEGIRTNMVNVLPDDV